MTADPDPAPAALGFAGERPTWLAPAVTGSGLVVMHAPLTPFDDRESALGGGGTPWRMLLDGTWRFRLLDAPRAAPAGFPAPDFDDADWDALEVPVSWVLQGH